MLWGKIDDGRRPRRRDLGGTQRGNSASAYRRHPRGERAGCIGGRFGDAAGDADDGGRAGNKFLGQNMPASAYTRSRRTPSVPRPLGTGVSRALAVFLVAAATLLGSPANAQPPAPVVSASVVGFDRVTLSWRSMISVAPQIQKFQVRYSSTDITGAAWMDITGSDHKTTGHTVTGLAGDTNYTFQVRAVNSDGNGSEALKTQRTLNPALHAPRDFSATGGFRKINLSWTRATDSTPVDRYEYRLSTDNGDNWSPDWTDIPGSSRSTTRHTVTGLTDKTTYTVELRSRQASVPTAAASTTATTDPRPPPPTGFRATGGFRKIDLLWTRATHTAVDAYQYRLSTDGGDNWSPDWRDIPGSGHSTTRHTVTGLDDETTYTVELRIRHGRVRTAAASTTATTNPTPPPTGFTATGGRRKIDLSWTRATHTAVHAYQYRLSTDGGYNWSPDWTDIPGSTHVTIGYTVTGLDETDLADETTYTVELRIRHGTGRSAAARTTVTTVYTGSPSAPTELKVTLSHSCHVDLDWSAPSSNGGKAIEKYEQRKRKGNGSFGPWLTDLGNPLDTHVTLAADTSCDYSYTFQVRAVNANGAGPRASITFRPLDDGPPNEPVDLIAVGGIQRVALSWKTPVTLGQILYYQVRYRNDGHPDNPWTSWTRIPNSDYRTTGHTVTGLEYNSLYVLEVRTVNPKGSGASAQSRRVRTLTEPAQAPAGFTATAGIRKVDLAWTAAASTVAVEAYQYRLSTDGGDTWSPEWTDIPGSNGSTTRHTVSPLANGTAYTVELRIRAGTTHSNAATQSATTPDVPSAPGALAAMPGQRSIELTWTTPHEGDRPITTYQYRRTRISPGFIPWTNIPGSGPNTTSYTHSSGLSDVGRRYTFEVRAVNAVGNGRAGSVDGRTAVSDDPTRPTIRTWFAMATEGRHAAVDFSVQLHPPASSTVTVDYRTEDRSATAPADYQSTSGTLTFAPGETEKTVSVPIVDDTVEDSREKFWLLLSNVSGARLGVERTYGVIYNHEDVLAGFTLVDAAAGTDVGALTDGTEVTLDAPGTGQYGVRVETLPEAAIGSLRLQLSGAKAVTRTDNAAPYTLYSGGGEGLPQGAYTLQATAYPDPEGGGTALQTLSVSFTVTAAEASNTVPDDPEPAPLTASFSDVPAVHDGSGSFGFEVAFSEDVGIGYATMRDDAFEVDEGDVTRARRVNGRHDLWEITVEPDGREAVSIALPGNRTCGTTGAVCTRGDDPKPLSNSPSATVAGPAEEPEVTNTAATGAPTISGTPQVGETLTASVSDISDADGLDDASFAYQWLRGDADIQGATESSYTLVSADEGETIKVRVTFSDDEGHEESLTSAAIDTVAAAPNNPATGAPAISGTAQVDETLTASVSDISDADGLDDASFAYQWLRGDADIQGATESSYTLVSADEGETIKVRVTFSDDEGHEESLTSVATDAVAPAPEPLTATFTDVPSEHAGEGETFTFGLTFSEEFGLSYKTLRDDDAFDIRGGEVRSAKRQQQGSNQSWTIHVEPSGHGPVTVTLPETTDCGATGAICTDDDRPLSHSLSATVAGPVGISVGDARVEEDDGAVLSFAVTLSRAASAALTVDYATSDGSAQAGVDYTAASGTLSFQAGESSKTIEVTVLDDSHDDDGETLTLTLSNPSSGRLTDAEATGTIENRDPLPRALLARFGRTAAVHVVEHVEERLAAPREPGFRGRFAGRELRRGMESSELALSFLSQLGGSAGANGYGVGGHDPMAGSPGAGVGGMGSLRTPGLARGGVGMPGAAGTVGAGVLMLGAGTGAMGGAGMMGGAPGPTSAAAGADRGLFGGGLHSMGLGGDNLLTGAAFAMNRESHGGILSFWSRGARSHFSGREGTLSLGGDVRTTMFGADYAKGPLVAGLSLSHSRGLGEYAGVAAGQVASAVTGLYPWLGYKATDRVTVWGVAGYGRGGLLLTPDSGTALESGLSMAMAAAGTRGELIAGAAGGFALAFKADALWVGTAIDGVDGPAGRLKATDAAVTRFRTGLEGSRAYKFAGRLSLRPSVEVGLRQDGGDAETGAGMDVGAGLIVSDSSTGLAVDVRVRTLLVHQAEGFRERGMALSLSYNPTPSTPLGFTAKVAPSWGGQAQSGADALWGRETMAGMGQGGLASGNRLDGEVGYGLPVGSRFIGTPRVGFSTSEYGRDYRVGYGLGVLDRGNVNFELGVDAQRRESPTQGEASNGFLGRATLGW